ncbi:hypothetical protein BDV95DRAFT_572261 [Neofusicoccum parvum]|nr:hypothetical protein BDV95DRAFT_572261 [Neofusicoccum parvum]
MKVVDVRITWLTAGSTELELGRSGAERQTVSAGTVSEQSSVAGKRVEEHDAVGKNHDEPGKVETVKLPPFDDDGIPYVEILSPAIREALRAVVDYYPEYNFDSKNLKIYWPYPVLTHYDEALERYQKRFENRECTTPTCSSQHAHKHISILRDFVRQKTGDSVDEERKRHERGYVTFEMLWLLFQPGDDVLYDMNLLGEPQPYVMKQLDWNGEGGSISAYSLTLWNIDANSEHIGPCDTTYQFNPFAGEKEITSLTAYPFKYFKRGKDGKTPAEVKKSLVERGKLFFELRKKGCWDFNGYGTTFPRRPFAGLVMVDPIQYAMDMQAERRVLNAAFEASNTKVDRECCNECQKIVHEQKKHFRFPGYSKINPLTAKGLTEHQYFICDRRVEAFLFKHREWRDLDISGIKPARYDKNILDTLVLEPHVKNMIQSLTAKYLKGLHAEEAKERSLDEQGKALDLGPSDETAWSADFVKGKGEGLIFLLHGKPGVGKTYTAECIAANAERPLLTLTCADIGTDPSLIEATLMRWFKRARSWNAIMLIDEADIYMEHRKVQDLVRNNLVAAFLRAMEYYKGILFLTTNRVGTFDEAFISRINITIYYRSFSHGQRMEVWETFFNKLEREREETMRIHLQTRDYIEESPELRQLQWNGREIRNAFQIAVALAETEGEKDARGRIIIKPDHIRSTVDMSKAFKGYIKQLFKKDEDSMAAARLNRIEISTRDEDSEQLSFK